MLCYLNSFAENVPTWGLTLSPTPAISQRELAEKCHPGDPGGQVTSSHTTLPAAACHLSTSLASGLLYLQLLLSGMFFMPCLHSWLPYLLLLVTQTLPCQQGFPSPYQLAPFLGSIAPHWPLKTRGVLTLHTCRSALVSRTKSHRGRGFSSFVHCSSVHQAGQIKRRNTRVRGAPV